MNFNLISTNINKYQKLLIILIIFIGIFCFAKNSLAANNIYIDEVRLYSRVLSLAEIAVQYRAGAGRMKVNTPITQAGPQSGLVGNWSFNGPNMGTTSANDLSGNSNTGWLIGGVTKVIGQIGQALQFDGSSAYVDAGNVSTVKTVAFWVKADGTADTTYFKGKLDEVRMYSRALSASEISQLYKLGAKNVKFGSAGAAPALSSVRPTSKILALNSTMYIDVTNGTIAATGFDTPTYYVDGVSGSQTIDNNWRFVAVTTGTGITASAVALGKAGCSLYKDNSNTYDTIFGGDAYSGQYDWQPDSGTVKICQVVIYNSGYVGVVRIWTQTGVDLNSNIGTSVNCTVSGSNTQCNFSSAVSVSAGTDYAITVDGDVIGFSADGYLAGYIGTWNAAKVNTNWNTRDWRIAIYTE